MGCTVGKVENIKTSIKAESRADHIEVIPHLTDDQKVVIQNNWQTLKLHIANIGVITYTSMFESQPQLIETFGKFKGKNISALRESGLLQQHALRVMAIIDKCITRLNQPSNMMYILREVGHLHKKYKVQPDDIQIILPHFLSAMKPYIQENWCEELEDAWITFLSLIFYHMREGMQQTDTVTQTVETKTVDT
ncbi:uncharacterized protein LOC123528166 [Mercenaria mercenaria]|uniref:uncharacterized protein LOC123528166 n=1 Tax=Mercenaria mercenaria TaxID=6596 RepID=UPI00234F5B23|nr:uncharacterized protein LOC123528166 [Mercenaria mercenaria]